MNIDPNTVEQGQEIEKYYDLQRRALVEKEPTALSELYAGSLRMVMKLAQRYENRGRIINYHRSEARSIAGKLYRRRVDLVFCGSTL